jgi:hypothetical protein
MLDHDATERVEKALPLVGRQGLPELAGSLRRRPLARARGGRQADRDRRMMALLADDGSCVSYTSPLTGAVRLPQS